MPRASLKKIKSALSRLSPAAWAAGVLLLACGAVAAVVLAHNPGNPSVVRLRTAQATYRLEVVTTEEDQQKGLSDRDRLAQDTGMLFAYSAEDDRCFWMKDMRLDIDIIWLDTEKRITHIEPDLSPKTYPEDYCARAQYIIELNAGEAAKNALKPGDTLDF